MAGPPGLEPLLELAQLTDDPSHPKEPTMQTTHYQEPDAAAFELRFQSLFQEGRAYAFPCDSRGEVDMDAMSESLRISYLFVRTMVGRDFSCPAVRRSTLQ